MFEIRRKRSLLLFFFYQYLGSESVNLKKIYTCILLKIAKFILEIPK